MKINLDRKLIERYLLGELAEADQTALELEMLTDHDKFEEVGAVENELIDSYVRGEMSRTDQDRFEDGYLVSPLHRERVAMAESFLAHTDRSKREWVGVMEEAPAAPWWKRWLNIFRRED